MTQKEALKPCSFCGGEAYFDHDDNGWNWIECGSCGDSTNAKVSAMDDCKPLLLEQWNRRKAQPAVAEQHKQEPVAVVDANDEGYWAEILPDRIVKVGQHLYAEAPQRKPLTNEEIERLRIEQEFDQWAISEGAFKYAARTIEAAHGIKENA